MQVLAELAAVVLGILGLTSVGTLGGGVVAVFTMAGLLVLGASAGFTCSTPTGTMARHLTH